MWLQNPMYQFHLGDLQDLRVYSIQSHFENMHNRFQNMSHSHKNSSRNTYHFDATHKVGYCLISTTYLSREVLNLSVGDTVIVNDDLEDKGVSQTRESRIVSSPATHKKMEFQVLGIIDYNKINTSKTENYIQADILISLRDAQDLFNVDHDKVSEIYIRADSTKINEVSFRSKGARGSQDLSLPFLPPFDPVDYSQRRPPPTCSC